jgi:hypothetical protein
VKDEVLFLRRSSSVLDFIELSVLVNHCWEPLLSLLASVEAVPAVVHEGVQPVVKAGSIVSAKSVTLDVDRLSRTVHSVGIKTIEDEYSEFSVAEVSVPPVLLLALSKFGKNVGRIRFSVVGENLKEDW